MGGGEGEGAGGLGTGVDVGALAVGVERGLLWRRLLVAGRVSHCAWIHAVTRVELHRFCYSVKGEGARTRGKR